MMSQINVHATKDIVEIHIKCVHQFPLVKTYSAVLELIVLKDQQVQNVFVLQDLMEIHLLFVKMLMNVYKEILVEQAQTASMWLEVFTAYVHLVFLEILYMHVNHQKNLEWPIKFLV